MKARQLLLFTLVLLSVFLFASCATISDPSLVIACMEDGQFDEAKEMLETEKQFFYSERDEVLYDIDSGLLAHYAGDWNQSNQRLSDAETLIDYYYSKSISQSVSSWISNDYTLDYDGDDYEDIYANLFMALNYIHLDQMEDAFVEIRRFDNKQKGLATKYAQELAEAEKEVDGTYYSDYSFGTVAFNNSALARYISMLMYRSRGSSDDVRVDLEQIKQAFQTQRQLYTFPMPSTIQEEVSVPRGKARLNILGFTGLAPVKLEDVTRVNSDTGTYFKLSLPYMVARGSLVDSIDVTAVSEDGKTYRTTLEKIESIENIAMDTFNQERALIYTKSLARAIAKSVATSAAYTASSSLEDSNSEAASLFLLLGVISQIHTEVTEVADLRTSQYFPAYASVGGITVNPGTYSVRVDFISGRGTVIRTEVYNDVTVAEDRLNLVEAICVR